MSKTLLLVSTLAALTFGATSAMAGACSEDQEAQAGMLVAGISKDTVSKVVPVTGKQMVNVTGCEFRAGSFIVDYKYNFLAADGLYWIEAQTRINQDGSGGSIKVNKASPNMAAAETKAGVKLAAN